MNIQSSKYTRLNNSLTSIININLYVATVDVIRKSKIIQFMYYFQKGRTMRVKETKFNWLAYLLISCNELNR